MGCALEELGNLVADDVAEHLVNPNKEWRRYCAYLLGIATDSSGILPGLLIDLLADSDSDVHLFAVQALEESGCEAEHSAIARLAQTETDATVLYNIKRILADAG